MLDKPSKPTGPLNVDNVTEDFCDLDWKPPKDDGGEPIEHYEVLMKNIETGLWVPCAKTKDCKASIKGLKKNQCYQFCVKAVNKEGASEPLITSDNIIAKNPYNEPSECSNLDIVDWDENHVDIKWDPPTSVIF